jgi:hypothetical protein
MRVLFINQFYVPDIAATGQLLADVTEELAGRGHEVHVICSRRAYRGGDLRLAREGLIDGVWVHRMGATGFGGGGMPGRLLDYASFYLLALLTAVRLPRMNVCVALTTPPFVGLIALVLHALRGTKIALWTMDLYPEVAVAFGVLREKSLLRAVLAWLSRRLYRQAGAIISLGEVMADRLAEAGAPREKIAIVHNWAPREIVDTASSKAEQIAVSAMSS